MFHSVRFKIIAAVLIQTCLIGLALFFIGKDLYGNYKKLQIDQCQALVDEETDCLAETLHSLEKNVQELALIGELLLAESPGSLDRLAKYAVTQNFNIQTAAVGGGIWYIPYQFGKDRELTCFYAFKKDNSTVFDASFSSQAYYYPAQKWYQEAMRDLKAGYGRTRRGIVWSPAYTDAAGICALMTTASAAIITSNGEIAGLATLDWSLKDIAGEIAAIRPTPGSITLFADIAHNVILNLNGRNQDECSMAGDLTTLAWFDANAPQKRTVRIDGNDYLSFSRKFDNGMIVVVNVPENELFHRLNNGLLVTLLSLFCAMLAVSILVWSILNRFINQPVTRLCRAAEKVGNGNLDTRFPSGNDELGALSQAFARMAANLKSHIAHIEAITAEKERIATELNIARDIQAAMLPNIFPARTDCSLAAIMKPAKEVGGDFYDFFFMEEHQLAVVMADVSGKGVPAALFMAIAKALVRNCIQACADPGAALEAANLQLGENNDACMFVTAFAGILDLRTGDFQYANAGHNPFYICASGKNPELVSVHPALPLAVMPNTEYETCKLKLAPGSGIFLYTDGVTEAAKPDGSFWGTEKLESALAEYCGRLPHDLSGFIADIMADLDRFTKGACQNDDITMLVLSWLSDSQCPQKENETGSFQEQKADFYKSRIFQAHLKALPDFMALLEEALEAGSFGERQRMRFCVAAEEIFVNIANYAYVEQPEEGQIEILLEVTGVPSTLRLRFTDSGKAFNPLEQEQPDLDLPAEERIPGGLGIFLAGKGASSIRYARESGKNILTMVLSANNAEKF